MPIDHRIWKEIAGAGKIPTVGSLVYYFPQGHAEQASSPPNFTAVAVRSPYSLCRVAAVRLLANPDTDEVFSMIRLHPIPSLDASGGIEIKQAPAPAPPSPQEAVSFAKILTPSDANNGGGFSMPRLCAVSIFPELDFSADPPVQNISVSDVHGNIWEFRHIYRGTPRRHLLTTGWSRFVNGKKLIAGDSVIFIKNNRDGKLFVGIRRTERTRGSPDFLKLDENLSVGSKDGFSRSVKGRVPPESIVEAVRCIELGCEFEVMYYPRAGSAEFVVEKEVVDRSLCSHWVEGMRVKMSVESEDSARMTSFQGTVRRIDIKDSGPWSRSPWRMLQVTWDEPEVLPYVRAISPWQVELVTTSPHMQAPFPAMKKLKVPEVLNLSSEGHGNILLPRPVTNSLKMGNSTPFFNFPTFPAGMQGARHDFFVPSLFDFVHKNTHHLSADNLYGIYMPEDLTTSQSEAASPPSEESAQDHSLELVGVAGCIPTRKISKGSFQLFGKIIHINQPNDDSVDDGDYGGNEGVQSLEFSLSFPCNGMLDGVDFQHSRIPSVEACPI